MLDNAFHLFQSYSADDFPFYSSWGDFILEGITTCIESAMSNEVELRKGLPFDYLQKLGTCKVGKFI